MNIDALARAGNRLAFAGVATLGYDDPRTRFLHARQLMRELHDWTVVALDQEPG
jgi:hypothetical protein